MATTVGDVIVRVQELLHDPQGVRYTPTEQCRHVADAYALARSVRPDLFVGEYDAELPDDADVTPESPFLLPRRFRMPVAMYVAGMCELRDDEFAVTGRAMTLREQLSAALVTGV